MQIGSTIKPRHAKTRTVHVDGTPYVFADRGDGHFVAEVENAAHAELLLSHPEGAFYDPRTAGGKPALARAPVKSSSQAPAKTDADKSEALPYSVEVQAEATALLGDSLAKIGAATGKVSSVAVLECALAIEKQAEKPRGGVVKLLSAAIEGAKQAGVK